MVKQRYTGVAMIYGNHVLIKFVVSHYCDFIFYSPKGRIVTVDKEKNMIIKYVDGHYEIVSADNGQFVQSADTWDEALDDMKELLQTR